MGKTERIERFLILRTEESETVKGTVSIIDETNCRDDIEITAVLTMLLFQNPKYVDLFVNALRGYFDPKHPGMSHIEM